MPLQDRGDTTAIIKGPGVDASMITRMKRQQAIVSDIKSQQANNGRKGVGVVVDGQHIRGFDNSDIRSTYINKGAGLSFFRVL